MPWHERLAAGLLAGCMLMSAAQDAPASGPLPARWPRAGPAPLRYAPMEVVVIADEAALDAAPDGVPRSGRPRLAGQLAALGLERARRADSVPVGGRRASRIWVLSSGRAGFDAVAAAAALRATGAVLAAIPNYRIRPLVTTPDDLYLVYQWYVDDGSYADIRLPYAWDLARGDTSVAIAIIDTGVDTGHPDLASRIWRNPGEIPDNGLDDDGNGLVDDVQGWDFGAGDSDPNPEYTADPSGVDVGFHGTFCAGIAAAATDNGDGIAGAGWDCRIMPLKAANPDSGLTSDAIAAAVAYAADQGASVISMSFGAPGEPGVPEFFQALVDIATEAGAVCVASAGNDGANAPTYPAACDDVLSVGATDFDNARASFSNWGDWVDVAAPGSLMWSTICRNYELSLLDQLFYMLLFGWDGVNPYMYGDGTSFACPLVAGVCGLVRARYPGLPPRLVIGHVIATGDSVAYDLPIGVKVNAHRAVASVPTAVGSTVHAPPRATIAAAPNPAAGSTLIRFSLPAGGTTRLRLFDAAGRCVRTLVEGTLPGGPHRWRWDGRSDRGVPLPAGVYFARVEGKGFETVARVVLLGR